MRRIAFVTGLAGVGIVGGAVARGDLPAWVLLILAALVPAAWTARLAAGDRGGDAVAVAGAAYLAALALVAAVRGPMPFWLAVLAVGSAVLIGLGLLMAERRRSRPANVPSQPDA